MKKILVCFILAFCLNLGINFQKVFAETATPAIAGIVNWDSAASLKRVNTIGSNILIKNHLPSKIVFKVSEDESVNAYSNINKEIYVQRGLLQYVENDDELAAVISHEIGHIVNAHIQKQGLITAIINYFTSKLTNEKVKSGADMANQLSMLKLSRSDEYESDLTGVDIMIVAGYNPNAMISVLNKICGNYMDVLCDHPSGDKRTMNIYDYMTYNYPAYVKKGFNTDSYNSFLLYAQPTIELRKTNPKALAKFQKKEAKLKAARIKRAQKIRSSNPWETTYSVLKTLSGS